MRTTFFGLLALTITACGPTPSSDAGTDVAHTTDVQTTSDVATDTTTSDTTTLDVPGDAPVTNDVVAHDATDVTTVADVATDTPTDAASDVPTSPDASCTRPTTDTGSIGTTCTAGRDTCAAGYTCQVHSGIIATYNCQITCRTDCECPTTLSCQSIVDKSGSHGECH